MAVLILAGSFYVGRLGAQMHQMHHQTTAAVSQEAKVRKVVVDAGHGGFDSGKVGINGALEKDINLEIARKVQQKLEQAGIATIMTRKTDQGLYDEGEENKKQQDMKRRCSVINESEADLAVSIHQNSYTQESICGPQVFYYESSAEGKKLAICIQEALNETLKIEHPRVEKSNRTYYLLKRSEGILNIVECGFLSNKKEAELLVQDKYQERVAKAVEKGILKYLED